MHSTVSIWFPFIFLVVLMSCMLLSCAQLFACLCLGCLFLFGYSLLASRSMLLCTASMHSTVSIWFPFIFLVVLMSCMLLSCAQLFACLLVRMLVTGIGSKVGKNIYADILVVHYKSVPTCHSFVRGNLAALIRGHLAWWQWYNNVDSVA
jgi:hypothetical protein